MPSWWPVSEAGAGAGAGEAPIEGVGAVLEPAEDAPGSGDPRLSHAHAHAHALEDGWVQLSFADTHPQEHPPAARPRRRPVRRPAPS
ncbi:hypothetical protein [Streptomyces sp. NPDC017202]|uniref:hypothetical protein n=1 Tax=Streptomyces sp. NPDC017202 TaxID=3364981 RepID=UPI0037AF1264